jgi:taurine dioxygenase
MKSYQIVKTERRSPHLGAFIEGVDLTQPLEDAAVAEIKAALLEFGVIFFRNQHISGEQHLEFAAHFGELDSPHPVFDRDDRDERLTIIESKGRAHDGEHYWHTDVTYQEAPSFGSILAAKKIPESGGDTLFASMYAAHDTLSAPIQKMLEELSAQHSFERGWGETFRMVEGGDDKLHELEKVFPLMTHPVLRTHPETGRTALFVNEYYTSRINELSEAESNGLLRLLHHHSQLPDFQIRHTWQEGDIAFWDNRCTQHYASNDYGAAHRIMNRVTIVGDKPYFQKPIE